MEQEINKVINSKMLKIMAVISVITTISGFLIITPFVMGILLMIIWNAVIPDIFALPAISYLQAVGLYFISGMLIKGDFSSLFSNITGIRKQ